jgi:predicted double-glycine peptidase
MHVFKTPALAGVLLSAVLSLTGCTTPQVAALLENRPPALPERVELAAVPFHPQVDYQCGPATLATVLNHAGIAISPEALAPQVYLPEREGSLQAEMLAAVRRHGLVAYRLAPRLEDALREIAAGTPVVVLLNLAFDFAPRWHYAVVVGYDLPREEIVLRSGTTQRLTTTLSNFERTWARSGHWAMLALAPEQLPESVTEDAYVGAAAALERGTAAAARRAYAAALARWPRNLVARIGLGNAAYSMKDLETAEAAYRQATRDHPQAADAWNNLAQALLELKRGPEALTAAQRAVELGGPRLAQYQATLKAITGAH